MTPSPILRKERSDEQSADRCKDTGAAQQSGERNRSRDKARKWRRASGGSSSSGARSRAGSSRGSSSLSASGRSGRSSGSRSSSSSSSSDFPRPWCPRDHGPRSRSKPKPPRRDEKERRRHSPAPKPTKVQVTRLTRKVTREHIREIFSTFGRVREIDLPRERMRAHPSQGHAYVEFKNPEEAAKALRHMDGEQSTPSRSRPEPCWPPGPSHRQATEPSPENAATTPDVAQAEGEQVAFPLGQIPRAPANLLPLPPPPLERLQLQLLPEVRAAVDTCPRAVRAQAAGVLLV